MRKIQSGLLLLAIVLLCANALAATAPTAINDAYSGLPNKTLTRAVPGVLKNDLNPDNLTLSAVLVEQAQHGTVTLNTNGSFSYVPDKDFKMDDVFRYKCTGGGLESNVASVTLVIGQPSKDPVAAFTATPTGGFAPLTVAFDGNTSIDQDGSVQKWTWNFGDGNNETSDYGKTSHTYVNPGKFTVTLQVTDDAGNKSATVSTTITLGDGQVSDGDLYVSKALFTVNWPKHNTDSFTAAGSINPAQLPVNLNGATFKLFINNTLLTTATLNETGSFVSAKGATPTFAVKLSQKTGAYAVKLGLAELRTVLGLSNATQTSKLPVDVAISIGKVTIRTGTYDGTLLFDYASMKDAKATGKFGFTVNSTQSGAFLSLKTAVTQQKTNGFTVSCGGPMLADVSVPVIPNGAILINFGASSTMITIPTASLVQKGSGALSSLTYVSTQGAVTGLKTFSISNQKRAFSFVTTELQGLGVPLTSSLAVSYELPVQLTVPTANGTITFSTTIEILRAKSSSPGWKR